MQLIEIFDLVSARLDAMQMSGREFSKLLNYPETWFCADGKMKEQRG